jgi:hypothetical protein
VQQDPLIPGSDTEHRARLVVRQSLDVAQQDDLALARRQVVEG